MSKFIFDGTVAGDGNAYIPYAYNERFRVRLRSDEDALNYPPDATGLELGMITNADTDVVPTWGPDYLQGEVRPTPTLPGNCLNSGTSYGVANMTGFLSNFIVAGDGNAYVAFAYNEFNACTIVKAHLRLLQLSSSGASNVLTMLDAAPLIYPPDATQLQLGLITNADTGVVLTWGLVFVAGESTYPTQYGMAITTGTSVSIVNGPILPGQPDQGGTISVIPILQAQDGSFVGSAWNLNYNQQYSMVAFDQGGNVLWMVPNEQPLIATADGGVIGQSGIIYDQNGAATGQAENPSAVISWSAEWYQLASGGVASVALPLINEPFFDDLSSASVWGFGGGNPSHNQAAFLECCYPSLAWVFGETDHSDDPPDVVKSYPLSNFSCTKSPSQIISDMEANFGTFANWDGHSSFHLIPWAVHETVAFTGTVTLGATINIQNVNVDSLTGGFINSKTFNVNVTVSQLISTSFTFTTLPGHVLYPATISFAASSPGAGLLNFTISVNGTFANKEAAAGYSAAGSAIEDNIWNNVLVQVKNDCSH